MGKRENRQSKVPVISPSAPITNQMFRHAGDPEASNFISFTDKLFIASVFTHHLSSGGPNTKPKGGILAVKVDSRRMFSNVLQNASTEREYLVPLVVFPDEVVVYVESSEDPDELKREFVKALKAKTGIDAETYEVPKEVYRASGYNLLNKVLNTETRNSALACKAQF